MGKSQMVYEEGVEALPPFLLFTVKPGRRKAEPYNRKYSLLLRELYDSLSSWFAYGRF